MRFGKKTRNLAAAGRRFFGERERDDAPSALAAVDEAAYSDHEEMAMNHSAPEEPMVAGDPTQRLLTALGRFQRQVNRAEEGASQEAWCDECMNQLIAGIEIALGEGWADVKEALTDTARVLQTYEDANRASDCVPFLKDSYEILCLMVGDLIVDNVRSGVMKKWRARYEDASNDLAAQGLTLVDDESARELEHHTIDTPDPFGPESYDGDHDQGAALDAGDAFDDLIGEPDGDGSNEFASQAAEISDSDPFSPVLENGLPFGAPREEGDGVDSTILPSLDDLLGGNDAPADDDHDLGLSNDFTADEPEAADPPQPFADEEDVFAVHGDLFETAPEPPAVAEEFAQEAPAPMELDLSPEPESESEPESEPETEMAVTPAPEPVAETAPAPEAEPEPGSALALLKTAQQAMALGNVADAKVFALQLAANMARLEADQVEARADAIKAEIDANIEDVAAAERTVADAEGRVRSLEEQNAQCQQEFEGKRQHVQELRSEVEAAEHSVADLERQIAELEARRDEERARLSDRQTSLDDTLSEESRMQAELDTLAEEEEGARENLDSARDRVRALQEHGGGRQADLEAARLELTARLSAVEDIERTIGHVGGGTPPGDGNAEAGAGDESGNEHGA